MINRPPRLAKDNLCPRRVGALLQKAAPLAAARPASRCNCYRLKQPSCSVSREWMNDLPCQCREPERPESLCQPLFTGRTIHSIHPLLR